MEQRHMQEKSRGAARPDVDARARAIQEQIIHIPRPAQPGNARPAAQSTAGHPSGAQQRPPQAARPRDDACAQRRRAAPAPAHTAPRGQAAGGRHYAAKPRKRRRAPGGGMFFACVAVVILSLSWVITTLIELPPSARRPAAWLLCRLLRLLPLRQTAAWRRQGKRCLALYSKQTLRIRSLPLHWWRCRRRAVWI